MKTTKALFIGGIKSGKSFNAEKYTLNISTTKPIYLATTEFIDEGMKQRVDEHKKNRQDKLETIEEPLKLFESIKQEIQKVLDLDKSIVFVLNDVGTGIIPDNKLAREFVDISGKISQQIAASCDEVYHTIAGISTKIK